VSGRREESLQVVEDHLEQQPEGNLDRIVARIQRRRGERLRLGISCAASVAFEFIVLVISTVLSFLGYLSWGMVTYVASVFVISSISYLGMRADGILTRY
jgi:hypothetical protein